MPCNGQPSELLSHVQLHYTLSTVFNCPHSHYVLWHSVLISLHLENSTLQVLAPEGLSSVILYGTPSDSPAPSLLASGMHSVQVAWFGFKSHSLNRLNINSTVPAEPKHYVWCCKLRKEKETAMIGISGELLGTGMVAEVTEGVRHSGSQWM